MSRTPVARQGTARQVLTSRPPRSRRSAHESMSTASSPIAGTARGRAARAGGAAPCRAAPPARVVRRPGGRVEHSGELPPTVGVDQERPVVAGRGLAQPPQRRRRHAGHVHGQDPDERGPAQEGVDAGEEPGDRATAGRVLADEGDRSLRPDALRRDHHDLVGVEEGVDRELQQGPPAQLHGWPCRCRPSGRPSRPRAPRRRSRRRDGGPCGHLPVGFRGSSLALLAPQRTCRALLW